MSKYTRLYLTESNLHIKGSPVIICASALLKDEQTGRVLIQAKFRNISKKVINGIKIAITMLDVAGREIGDVVTYTYLDIKVFDNAEIGEKTPVYLPENEARKYHISVSEVCFTDGSVWTCESCAWESIGTSVKLSDYFENKDLLEQFYVYADDNFYYVPRKLKNVWCCSCGKIHFHEVAKCCGMSYDEQIELLNKEKLKEKVYTRAIALKEEADVTKDAAVKYDEAIKTFNAIDGYKDSMQLAAECAAKVKNIKNNKKQTTKKNVLVGCIAVAVIALVIVFAINVAKNNRAKELYELGLYHDAIEMLGGDKVPKGVTKIGEGAFAYRNDLKSITIPNSVTSVERYAFQICNNLESIKIPDSVTTIADNAFDACNSLTTVYYSGTEEEWNAISIGSGNKPLTDAKIVYNKTE